MKLELLFKFNSLLFDDGQSQRRLNDVYRHENEFLLKEPQWFWGNSSRNSIQRTCRHPDSKRIILHDLLLYSGTNVSYNAYVRVV